MSLSRKNLLKFAGKEKKHYERMLQKFVNIPSVSADPEHQRDIERAAKFGCQVLRKYGADAQILRAGRGNPVVYGSFQCGNQYPTVTVYNHLDVQPADRKREGWQTHPFVFTKQGGRYFGRGTTDDKGPALAALLGARAALDAGIKINIRFLWETEEEIGSPNFDRTLRQAGKTVVTDSVIVSDTMWLSRNRPTITSGLRGFQSFRFVLETGESDQHSGDTGGAARNPLGELMKVVCEIYDAETGVVKVPGFYRGVVKPGRKELEHFRRSGLTTKQFLNVYRFKSLRTYKPLEIMKRTWALPTFEIHGVVGGYTGPGIKAIVPPHAEVKASCRLVPDQDPKRIASLIRDFVRRRHPDVQVHTEMGGPAYRGITSGPYADAVRRAIRFAFGKEAAFVREGGSIGAVIFMQRTLRCPVLFLGLSLPEHGYHAPNENFDWKQASGGIVAFAKYFEELSQMRRD